MPIGEIKYNGSIDIARAGSRKAVSWRNEQWDWSKLVTKLSETQKTHETHAEYIAAKKARQDEIKDVGGFVGGYLTGGRRKAGNVLHRQLITLDIDFAQPGIWDHYTVMYGNAAVMYSTHKHAPESPRLRLIIPLSRPVAPDEYVAIARRIAGNLGIDNFDHTTFEPSRLMYWPSTSRDGEYLFEFLDAEWLDADETLKTYHNWNDSSEWPVSERYNTIIQKKATTQEDPTIKNNLVGAFCRTYSIYEAIEQFLSDVYSPTDVPDRYTYIHGSTTAGMVIYEGKFAYSNHGTDPATGELRNAFDLVRIHKFGLRDEDVRDSAHRGNNLPSYTAMVEFVKQDEKVRKLLVTEKLENARIDFAEEEIPVEENNTEWYALLVGDSKGNILPALNNIVTILENDPMLKNRIIFDEFEHCEVMAKKLHWRHQGNDNRRLEDADISNFKHYLIQAYEIKCSKDVIEDALKVICEKNRVHPLKQYFDGLEWDGKRRVDTLLIDYLGADDNEYTRAVTRKTLVAAITRIYRPGVKFDTMLTLIGKQGIGKSTLFDKLGGDWFSDNLSFSMLTKPKLAEEQIQGAWIIEIGEMTGLKKTDMETAKSFISRRVDRYRVAYGKRVSHFPRQCIFVGTTNKTDFLRDVTGNRRFWPVATMRQAPAKNVFTDITSDVIGNIWAEAVHYYKQGETLHLDTVLEATASQVQEVHTEVDERIGTIEKYLNTLLPENWLDKSTQDRIYWLRSEQTDDFTEPGEVHRKQVCAAEIWCELFEGKQKDMTTINTKFIHEALRKIPGWEVTNTTRKFGLYGYQRAYVKTTNSSLSDANSGKTLYVDV